jgi:hypothetical protein
VFNPQGAKNTEVIITESWPWGLHSHKGLWVRDRLAPISVYPGRVKVLFDHEPIIGASQSLTDKAPVLTTYDSDSGWVRLSWGPHRTADDYIEFAENTVVGLVDEELVSLWLRPIWYKEEGAPLLG